MTDLTALERLRFNDTYTEVINARGGFTTLDARLDTLATGGGTEQLVGKFVSPDGSNSNDGSELSPYLTITYALTQVTSGDTIYLMAGETENYMRSVGTTVNVNGITIANHPTAPLKLTNSTAYTSFTVNGTYSDVYQKSVSAPVYGVWLNDTTRLSSVAGLSLCHSTANSYYYDGSTTLYVHSDTSPTIVRVNDSINRILIVSASNITLEDLEFEFSTQSLELTGDNHTITGLRIENGNGILTTQYAVKFTGTGLTMTDFVIDAYGQHGILTNTTVDSITLRNGIVTNASGDGIELIGGSVEVEDVIVTGGFEAAFRFRCGGTYKRCTAVNFERFGFYHDDGNSIVGYDSLAYQSADSTVETTENWGFVGDRDTVTTDFQVFNCTAANLLRNATSATVVTQAGFGINCDGVVNVVGCISINNYNGFAKLPALTPSSFTHEYNWSYNNTDDWYGITPGGTEYTVDPELVDPSNDDYSLQSTSPCIDAIPVGTSGIRSDYSGDSPDAGRFEYQAFNQPLLITESSGAGIYELFVVWPDGRRTKLAVAGVDDVSETLPVVDTDTYLGGYL